jgi:hypothetical protein
MTDKGYIVPQINIDRLISIIMVIVVGISLITFFIYRAIVVVSWFRKIAYYMSAVILSYELFLLFMEGSVL